MHTNLTDPLPGSDYPFGHPCSPLIVRNTIIANIPDMDTKLNAVHVSFACENNQTVSPTGERKPTSMRHTVKRTSRRSIPRGGDLPIRDHCPKQSEHLLLIDAIPSQQASEPVPDIFPSENDHSRRLPKPGSRRSYKKAFGNQLQVALQLSKELPRRTPFRDALMKAATVIAHNEETSPERIPEEIQIRLETLQPISTNRIETKRQRRRRERHEFFNSLLETQKAYADLNCAMNALAFAELPFPHWANPVITKKKHSKMTIKNVDFENQGRTFLHPRLLGVKDWLGNQIQGDPKDCIDCDWYSHEVLDSPFPSLDGPSNITMGHLSRSFFRPGYAPSEDEISQNDSVPSLVSDDGARFSEEEEIPLNNSPVVSYATIPPPLVPIEFYFPPDFSDYEDGFENQGCDFKPHKTEQSDSLIEAFQTLYNFTSPFTSVHLLGVLDLEALDTLLSSHTFIVLHTLSSNLYSLSEEHFGILHIIDDATDDDYSYIVITGTQELDNIQLQMMRQETLTQPSGSRPHVQPTGVEQSTGLSQSPTHLGRPSDSFTSCIEWSDDERIPHVIPPTRLQKIKDFPKKMLDKATGAVLASASKSSEPYVVSLLDRVSTTAGQISTDFNTNLSTTLPRAAEAAGTSFVDSITTKLTSWASSLWTSIDSVKGLVEQKLFDIIDLFVQAYVAVTTSGAARIASVYLFVRSFCRLIGITVHDIIARIINFAEQFILKPQTSASIENQSGSPNPLGVIILTTVCGAFYVVRKNLPTLDIFETISIGGTSFLKWIGELPKTISGLSVLFESISKCLPECIQQFLGFEDTIELDGLVKDADKWRKEATLLLSFESNQILNTAISGDVSSRIQKCYSLGLAIYNGICKLDPKNSKGYQTSLHQILVALRNLRNNFDISSLGANRVEPFCFCLTGIAGAGKSKAAKVIAQILSGKDLPMDKLVWTVPKQDDYASGYAHQPVCFFDDFSCDKTDTTEFRKFIAFKNTAACQLNMAALEQKGMFFDSEIIAMTTNDPYPNINGFHAPAIHRRRDELIQVSLRPEFANVSTYKSTRDCNQSPWDVNAVLKHPQAHLFPHLEFTILHPTNPGVSCPASLTFSQIVKYLWGKYQNFLAVQTPNLNKTGIANIIADINANVPFMHPKPIATPVVPTSTTTLPTHLPITQSQKDNPNWSVLNQMFEEDSDIEEEPQPSYSDMVKIVKPVNEKSISPEEQAWMDGIDRLLQDSTSTHQCTSKDAPGAPFQIPSPIQLDDTPIAPGTYQAPTQPTWMEAATEWADLLKKKVVDIYNWFTTEHPILWALTKASLFLAGAYVTIGYLSGSTDTEVQEYFPQDSGSMEARRKQLRPQKRNYKPQQYETQDSGKFKEQLKNSQVKKKTYKPQAKDIPKRRNKWIRRHREKDDSDYTTAEENDILVQHLDVPVAPTSISIADYVSNLEPSREPEPLRLSFSLQGSTGDIHRMVVQNRVVINMKLPSGVLRTIAGLGIYGDFAIFPRHAFFTDGKLLPNNTIFEFSLNQHYSKATFPMEWNHELLVFPETIAPEFTRTIIVKIDGKDQEVPIPFDFAIYRMKGKVNFQTLVPHFATWDQILSVDVIQGELVMRKPETTYVYPVTVRPEYESVWYADNEYNIFMMLKYRLTTVAGDCGSPLILKFKGNNLIAGIHTAGSPNIQIGLTTVVPREILYKMLGPQNHFSTPEIPICNDVGYLRMTLGEKDQDSVDPSTFPNPDARIGVLGVYREKAFTGTKHGNVPSPFSKDFEKLLDDSGKPLLENTTGPSVLSASDPRLDESIDFHRKMMERASIVADRQVPVEAFDESIQECKKILVNGLSGDREMDIPFRKYTYDEVLNGLPGCEHFAPIDISTGCGYPWTRDKEEPKPGKHPYIHIDEKGHKTVKSKRLKRALRMMESAARHRILLPVIWQIYLKDENRPIPKIVNGDTRSVVGPPIDFLMVCKRYFGAIIALLTSRNNDSFSTYGMDANSAAWHNFISLLREYAEIGIATDFKTFDASLMAALLRAFCKLCCELYQQYDPDWCIEDDYARWTLINSVIFSKMFYQFFLLFKVQGNPSGCPFTTTMNCIINFLAHHYLFKLRYPNESFVANVRMFVCGDDNIQTVRKACQEGYNMKTLIHDFKEILGMTATAPDKSEVVSEFLPIDQLSYLKAFNKRVGDTDVPCVVKPTIQKLFHWVSKELDPFQAMDSNIHDAMTLAWAHGKTYYKQLSSAVRAVYSKNGREIHIPSWASNREAFKRFPVAHYMDADD
jgi:hypothetical protein